MSLVCRKILRYASSNFVPPLFSIFGKLDINGDGELDEKEFIGGCMDDSELVRLLNGSKVRSRVLMQSLLLLQILLLILLLILTMHCQAGKSLQCSQCPASLLDQLCFSILSDMVCCICFFTFMTNTFCVIC